MSIIHCVSVSGGKDSLATAILALETQPRESLRFVFADTGNEEQTTLDYLREIDAHLGLNLVTLPQPSFADRIIRKREFVQKHWPKKGASPTDIERAVKALEPTGNPFLDLCIWKGRFPSRKAQFCTQELKTIPLVEYQMSLIESGQGDAVWSWQGVRIDESDARRTRLQGTGACVNAFEEVGGGLYTYRPILRWRAADCFEAGAIYGVRPNPLYLQNMSRVGCMPCINANKDEVLEISKRFPGHIDRIEWWEWRVGQAGRKQEASFFPDPDRDAHLNKRGIRNMVKWSQTQRGGKVVDWIRVTEEPRAYSSAYGLCE